MPTKIPVYNSCYKYMSEQTEVILEPTEVYWEQLLIKDDNSPIYSIFRRKSFLSPSIV
jgi:hypothetical protein